MNRLLIACAILFINFFLISNKGITLAPLIINLNMDNTATFPKNFRVVNDGLSCSVSNPPSFQGLIELNASASGQFSEQSLIVMLQAIPSKNIMIVDLRQESHGFINGKAVSWYSENNWANKDKTLDQILDDENSRLNHLTQDSYASVYREGSPARINVEETYSEAELTAKYNLEYYRIPATDHLKPSDQNVDLFIALINSKPDDLWLHFHCAAGRGRATTFFVMYDMMKNAKSVSFSDIILRHSLIGGKDLLEFPHPTSSWKYPFHVERMEFLKEFYNFCVERETPEQRWSAWLEKNGKAGY
jgi:hypothetical protein